MTEQNPYLTEFFANTQRARDNVLTDRTLVNRICDALGVERQFPKRFLVWVLT
jgi:hypothetical protein